MKTKLSPTLLGLVVIGSGLLLLAGVLAFGGASLFTRPQRFVVYFDESVQGLDPGSAVKVRGVRVGRVADINVRFDPGRHLSEVEVICEISKNVLVTPDGGRIDFSAPGQLEVLVKQGMRAELAVQGLATGLLYVDLSFHEPEEYPLRQRSQPLLYPQIPAVPSAIAEFTASITDLLAKLRQIDFAGISTELKTVLAAARSQIETLQLQPAIDEVKGAAMAVRVLASDPQIRTAFDQVNRTLSGVQTMLGRIDQQVAPTGEELRRTLVEARGAMEQFNAAAASVRRLVGPQTGIGDETLATLQRVAEAAVAVQRLVDFLERNPNALLTGRAGPVPEKTKKK